MAATYHGMPGRSQAAQNPLSKAADRLAIGLDRQHNTLRQLLATLGSRPPAPASPRRGYEGEAADDVGIKDLIASTDKILTGLAKESDVLTRVANSLTGQHRLAASPAVGEAFQTKFTRSYVTPASQQETSSGLKGKWSAPVATKSTAGADSGEAQRAADEEKLQQQLLLQQQFYEQQQKELQELRERQQQEQQQDQDTDRSLRQQRQSLKELQDYYGMQPSRVDGTAAAAAPAQPRGRDPMPVQAKRPSMTPVSLETSTISGAPQVQEPEGGGGSPASSVTRMVYQGVSAKMHGNTSSAPRAGARSVSPEATAVVRMALESASRSQSPSNSRPPSPEAAAVVRMTLESVSRTRLTPESRSRSPEAQAVVRMTLSSVAKKAAPPAPTTGPTTAATPTAPTAIATTAVHQPSPGSPGMTAYASGSASASPTSSGPPAVAAASASAGAAGGAQPKRGSHSRDWANFATLLMGASEDLDQTQTQEVVAAPLDPDQQLSRTVVNMVIRGAEQRFRAAEDCAEVAQMLNQRAYQRAALRERLARSSVRSPIVVLEDMGEPCF